jgi:PAS domain S-box-containing protein
MNVLLKPFARLKTVERKVLTLVVLLVCAMATYEVVGVAVNKRVRIGGPLYRELALAQDLNADVVNPRLYVGEAYFTAHEMVEHAGYGEWTDVAALIEQHRALEREHKARTTYWDAETTDPAIRAALEETRTTATVVFGFIDREVIPRIQRRELGEVRQALKGDGSRLFAAHRRAAGNLRNVISAASERTEQRAATLVGRFGIALDVAAVLTLALFTWILLVGLQQLVLRPVERAKRHFEAIGAGDYSTPVLTRRVDEIGDMLRGLERMRVNLASAIAGRDEAERRHLDILDRSLQGFYQSTAEGRFLAANPMMAKMLGYESVEALLAEPAGTAERMYVDLSQRREFVRLMDTQGFVTGFETALRRQDGRVIWVTETARVVTNDDGTQYREGFIDDITTRKEAEGLKADFVSFVTHQLRTPLAGIRWMLELAEQGTMDDEVATCVEDARLSAERLIALVNDLLDVARLEGGRFVSAAEPTAMIALTRDVLGDLGPLVASRQQQLTIEGDTVDPVMVDPQLARQAVINFLSNAIKYTSPGGSIHVSASRDGEMVRWSVRDTGIGIPTSAQARLFEKFFRADNAQVIDTEGTGLGLYLVRLIAERAGGAVACESQEGEGSTFTLTLPVAEERTAVA